MSGLNRVMLIGNLGNDPELRYTPSGAAVCNFNLATNKRFTDSSGKERDETEWHRIVCWQKQAENVAKYLKKGKLAYVEGELRTRSWEDDAGVKRYATEIQARTVQFLEKGGGGGGSESAPPKPSDDDLPF